MSWFLPFCILLLAAPPGLAAIDISQIGFEQRLNEAVPADLALRDESGKAASLGRYLDGRPALLVLSDYRCRKLCGLVLEGLAESLASVQPGPGKAFRVIVVGLRPDDGGGAAQKANLALRHPNAGVEGGWHFLSGDATAIEALARSIGFRYAYDPAVDQYVHPAGFVLLTGAGRIARYLPGLRFAPLDLQLGLVDAANGRIGSTVEHLLLLCYDYDPASGRYNFAIIKALRLMGLASVVLLGGLLTLLTIRATRQRRHTPNPAVRPIPPERNE